MSKYYAINWELKVYPLGDHPDFDSADRATEDIMDDIMYIASEKCVKELRENLVNAGA